MPRPKMPVDLTKGHLTATVQRKYLAAIKAFRDDPKNLVDGEKPSRSSIVERALAAFFSIAI